jgi:DNA end-binding protein Ku
VVRGQGSIVAIKPCGKGLLMETLRYPEEVKKASTTFDDVPAKKADKDLIDLAEDLIEKRAGEFHPEKFKDSYTVALRELIEAKREHRKPRAVEEAPPASNVINLMDALKRSVKGGAANDDRPAARGRKSSARRAKKPRASKAKRARKRAHKKAA